MRKRSWLVPILALATLVLSACGTVAEPDGDGTLLTMVAPSDTIVSADDALLTADYWMSTEAYGGPFEVCWAIATEPSDTDFVLNYTPPGYVWELGVVSTLGTTEHVHEIFVDPSEGDVFETGGYDQVIVCKNPEPEVVGGCSLTQGYWKTHSAYGPAPYDGTWAMVGPDGEDTMFYGSGQTWYEVLWTPPRGDAYYNLAHQFIAASLNALHGSDTTVIDDALAQADELFQDFGPGEFDRATRGEALALASMLDAYNNGDIGPGHCD